MASTPALKRWHRYSGAFLSLFITQHLLTHLTALYHPSWHLAVMDYARLFYRQIFIEPLLWGAIVLQFYSGLRLVRQRAWKTRRDSWDRWQVYSGIYLAFFLMLHTGATLYGRFGLSLDTNFWYGAAVVQTRPHVFFFAPYYALGIVAYGVHMTALLRQWNLRRFGATKANQQAKVLIGGIVVLAGLILWALMQEMALPEAYVL